MGVVLWGQVPSPTHARFPPSVCGVQGSKLPGRFIVVALPATKASPGKERTTVGALFVWEAQKLSVCLKDSWRSYFAIQKKVSYHPLDGDQLYHA